jgi:DNA (cytosine-5)-methyltransferase 1
MNQFFHQVEAALLPTANQYAPEGTEPKALAHQWIHALAYGFTPFTAERGASKSKLIGILKKAQLYTDAESFKNMLPSTTLKPLKESSFAFINLFAVGGGMKIGFQKTGGTFVFSSQFEKSEQATYADKS